MWLNMEQNCLALIAVIGDSIVALQRISLLYIRILQVICQYLPGSNGVLLYLKKKCINIYQ